MLLVDVILLGAKLISESVHIEDVEIVHHPVTCGAFGHDCFFAAITAVKR